ncbi:ATP-binding protein [Anabaena azotica FACHB-119]|uniref:ATP-binding protein n=1 Tax=Anabaena azotica FACHB-119 TaxID=947527 RepID=A0ABR8D3A2_9NOST|nr:ATP-binding protein [Anabaena azotica FACHB-119]
MSQLRLLSFTIDGWTALGGQVSISLCDGLAVLVGRNGAGKSAILEGFEALSSLAIGRYARSRIIDSDSIPKILDIEISTPTQRRLQYRYELIFLPTSKDNLDIDDSTSETPDESQFSWNEHCQYVDGEKELLWTTEAGVTTLNNNGDPSVTILGDTTSLRQSHLPENARLKLPQEMQWVYAVLRGVHFLGKEPIRQASIRRPSVLRVSSKGVSFSSFGLADQLARKIFRRIEMGELDELESVCQRIGLGRNITIQKFILSGEARASNKDKDEEYLASVLLDDVNIGLLSDGTLRVLSILLEIISSRPHATTIIEEPETQIHPAMLAKLLNEIETYTFTDNLILSTHSPQVVAWTKPEKINLVYRNNGRTNVRKLYEEEIQKVVDYLCEEGDLGDWLYSGIIDE